MVGDVLDRCPEDLAVGDDEAAVVEGVEGCSEQFDFVDSARLAGHVDHVAHVKRPEHEKHDAGGEVAERALERQADGDAGRADDGGEAGGFDAEGTQARQDHQHDDRPTGQLAEELGERFVDPGEGEALAGDVADPAGDDPPGDQHDQRHGHPAAVGHHQNFDPGIHGKPQVETGFR